MKSLHTSLDLKNIILPVHIGYFEQEREKLQEQKGKLEEQIKKQKQQQSGKATSFTPGLLNKVQGGRDNGKSTEKGAFKPIRA